MSDSVTSTIAGYVGAVVAALIYGSIWIVPKKFTLGDGVFYQWVMCIGIFMSGVFCMLIRGSSQGGPIYFEPFAMIGGALWTTGNMLCVPIVQLIGLSLGPAVWGVGNMVTGWITGTFGLFGMRADKDYLKLFWLNCVGMALVVLSIPSYAFIKPKKAKKKKEEDGNYDTLNKNETKVDAEEVNEEMVVQISEEVNETKVDTEANEELVVQTSDESTTTESNTSIIGNTLSSFPIVVQRLIGFVLAIIAGIFFGSNYDPIKYLIDKELSSDNALDYVISHFVGILVTSTIYFISYAIAYRNKPIIYQECIVPGFIAGILWGIAQIGAFISNSNLPYVVSYPIATTGTGFVSAIWGIVVFREFNGIKDFGFFFFGTIVLILGIVCIVVSN
ncbi:Transmembrane protein [Entamoeba marina]